MKIDAASAFLEKGDGNKKMDDDKQGEDGRTLLNDKEIDAKMGRQTEQHHNAKRQHPS